MATITASTVISEVAQKDGRFWTHERHTDNIGAVWTFDYLAVVGTNVNPILAARAITLAAQLAANEIANNVVNATILGSLATITLNYSTSAQNAASARAFYQTATQLQAVMLGDFLSTLTDLQLQSAFNLTAGQVTTLRTNKLTPAANLATSIRATSGQ